MSTATHDGHVTAALRSEIAPPTDATISEFPPKKNYFMTSETRGEPKNDEIDLTLSEIEDGKDEEYQESNVSDEEEEELVGDGEYDDECDDGDHESNAPTTTRSRHAPYSWEEEERIMTRANFMIAQGINPRSTTSWKNELDQNSESRLALANRSPLALCGKYKRMLPNVTLSSEVKKRNRVSHVERSSDGANDDENTSPIKKIRASGVDMIEQILLQQEHIQQQQKQHQATLAPGASSDLIAVAVRSTMARFEQARGSLQADIAAANDEIDALRDALNFHAKLDDDDEAEELSQGFLQAASSRKTARRRLAHLETRFASWRQQTAVLEATCAHEIAESGARLFSE